MSTVMKALVVVGAILLALLIAAGAIGYYFWSRHGKQIVDSSRQARSEGVQYGEESDDQGCLDETLSRQTREGGFAETIVHSLFLGGCLSASEPTDGFCDRVPKRKDRAKSSSWQTKRCAEAGLNDPYCPQLFVQVQEYCESGLAGEGARSSSRARD